MTRKKGNSCRDMAASLGLMLNIFPSFIMTDYNVGWQHTSYTEPDETMRFFMISSVCPGQHFAGVKTFCLQRPLNADYEYEQHLHFTAVHRVKCVKITYCHHQVRSGLNWIPTYFFFLQRSGLSLVTGKTKIWIRLRIRILNLAFSSLTRLNTKLRQAETVYQLLSEIIQTSMAQHLHECTTAKDRQVFSYIQGTN